MVLRRIAITVLACVFMLATIPGARAQVYVAPMDAQTSQSVPRDVEGFLKSFAAKWTALSGRLGADTILYQVGVQGAGWNLRLKAFGSPNYLQLDMGGWFMGIPRIARNGKRYYFTAIGPESRERFVIEAVPNELPRILTSMPANAGRYDVSPDGTEIAYDKRDEGAGYQIFRKDLRTGATIQFTDAGTGGLLPAYSPDGRKIAYFSRKALRIRDIATREERVLAEDGLLKELPAWSPDGKRIAYQASVDPVHSYEIFVADIDASTTTRLTHAPGLDVNPCFSEDGTQILFTSQRRGAAGPELFCMSADGKQVLCDSKAGSMVFFPVAHANFPRPAERELEPTPQTAVANATPVPPPPITPDRSLIKAPSGRSVTDLLQELAANRDALNAALDGAHLLYVVHGEGGFQLKAKTFGQNDETSLVSLGDPYSRPQVLHSPERLFVKFLDRTRRQNCIVRIERDKPATLFAELPADPELDFEHFNVSPNETELLIEVKIDEISQIYNYRTDTGETRPVTKPDVGGVFPSWSPVGRSFAYVAGGTLRVKDIATNTEKELLTDELAKQLPTWSADGRSLLLNGKGIDENAFDIYRVDLATGQKTRLTQAKADDMLGGFSPDASRIHFLSERDEGRGKGTIYRMFPDGSGTERDQTSKPGIIDVVQ